ncbi:hypothetical protein [Stenotrophomonas sp. VV52]|uniref:hypothetical protein n=1 Tax=Stenotrophomonas sp. VV52 TaxID=2066958 RepID=UPI0011AF8CD7|nr:hypothetical protein [Stenotrophomonas sp. VV52]
MPGISNALSGASAATRPASNPVLRAMLSRMVLNDVRNGAGPVRCRLTHARGTHERMAYADAMSVSRSVMETGKASLSRDEQVSIGKGIDLLGTRSAEQLGPVLVEYLTTFGAVRGAIVELLREGADAERLAPLLDKFDKNLVTIGIRMGECKGIPDAARNKYTGKVCDAVEAGKKLMVKCAGEVGSEELLRGVAQSILPNSILQSLTERQPHLVEAFQEPDGAKKLLDVIVSTAAHKLEAGLISHIGTGGAESFSGAVLDLLKTAEYIVPGQKGQAGESPADPVDVNAPVRPDELRNLAGPGAPVLYNNVHSPVKVVNELGDLVKFMERDRSLPLNEVRNLVSDAHRRGQRLGAVQERLRTQSDLIAKLLEDNARLRNIVSRSEFTSQGVGTDNDSSLKDPLPRSDLKLDHNQREDIQRSDAQLNTDAHSEELLRRAQGTGDDITRPTPPRADDQVDGRKLDVKDGTESTLLKDDALRQLASSPVKRQFRVGDGLVRSESRTEANTSSKRDVSAGSGSPVQEDEVVGEFERYLQTFGFEQRPLPRDPHQPFGPRNLKQADAGDGGPAPTANRTLLPSDLVSYRDARALSSGVPFTPVSTGRVGQPLSGRPQGEFAEFVDRLGVGNVSPTHVMDRNGRGSVPPASLVIRGPVSELERAFESHRSRKMNPLLQPASSASPHRSPRPEPVREADRSMASDFLVKPTASPTELSSPRLVSAMNRALERAKPTTIPSPLTILARSVPWPPTAAPNTVARGRSDSLASISSTGSRADSLREEILSGSKSPRGAATRQVRFDDKIEYFSDADSAAWDSGDSGNESPLVQIEADWAPQQVDRVADRTPRKDEKLTAKMQMGDVIAELKQMGPRQLRPAL